MSHGLAFRCSEAGDVADHGLGDMGSNVSAARSSASPPISPIITMASVSGSASNAWRASMCGADDRVTPNAHRGGEAEVAQLVHHLVGQRAGLGDQPDTPGLGDVGGMIPALDCPGEISPGQLGPTSRVELFWESAKNSAVSLTGTPSVITTASGMPASIASTTADKVNLAGRRSR